MSLENKRVWLENGGIRLRWCRCSEENFMHAWRRNQRAILREKRRKETKEKEKAEKEKSNGKKRAVDAKTNAGSIKTPALSARREKHKSAQEGESVGQRQRRELKV
ncbi:hypothetical protein EDD15DRAFT_2200740 [Pisolithus albus]|nr:hypothetical protein EDD15DRAFT_2200740 [Pisolithus albus]